MHAESAATRARTPWPRPDLKTHRQHEGKTNEQETKHGPTARRPASRIRYASQPASQPEPGSDLQVLRAALRGQEVTTMGLAKMRSIAGGQARGNVAKVKMGRLGCLGDVYNRHNVLWL